MKHITRMDYGRTHGWWVRFFADGRTYKQRFFAGAKSNRKVLKKAKVYRDRLAKNHSIDSCHNVTRGWSKIPGVSVGSQKNGQYFGWIASYKFQKKSYSILHHGYQGAFIRAYRWRQTKRVQAAKRLKAPWPARKDLRDWLRGRGIEYPKRK